MKWAMFPREPTPRIALVILVVAASLAFFWGASTGDIHNFDSLMLSTVARLVVETGDWSTLHYPDAGTPWYHHPPLGIWGIAAGFVLFGVTTLGARLFSAACGYGTVLVAAAIGWKVRGPWAGFLSGTALMACPYFVKMSRRPRLDAPLTFFIAAAVLGILIAERRRWGWALFGLATGLAILTKGIVGLAPLGIAPITLALMGRWRWGDLAFWGGCLLALAVPLPWAILHARSQGGAILEPYFVDRVWGAIQGKFPDPRGPHYYFLIGMKVGLPWFPLGIFGLLKFGREAWRSRRKGRARREGRAPGRGGGTEPKREGERLPKGEGMEMLPVVVWGAAILIPFSLVTHKHAYYLIPFLPVAAVVSGVLLDRWLGEKVKGWLAVGLGSAAALAALILPFGVLPVQREKYADMRALQGVIQRESSQADLVATYRMRPQLTSAALAFYAKRRAGENFRQPAPLREAVESGEVRFLYLREKEWIALEPEVRGGEVLGRAKGSLLIRFGGN